MYLNSDGKVSSGIHWKKHFSKYPHLGITLVHVVCIQIKIVYNFTFARTYHAINLTFAELEYSAMKSLSRLIGCLFFFRKNISNYTTKQKIINSSFLFFFLSMRYYIVCTHNRIRSPRLVAFGRIETRWVREIGKFGPYLR